MSHDEKSSYYDAGDIEVIEIMKAKLTPEQFEGYLLGNVMKYSLRCNFKGDLERDVEKMEMYSSMLREFHFQNKKVEKLARQEMNDALRIPESGSTFKLDI